MNHTNLSHINSLPLIIAISLFSILFSVSWYLFFLREERNHFPTPDSFFWENPTSAASHSLSAISHLKTALQQKCSEGKPIVIRPPETTSSLSWRSVEKGVEKGFLSAFLPLPIFFSSLPLPIFFSSLHLYFFFAEWDVMNKNKSPMILYLKLYVACSVPVWVSDDISLQRNQAGFVRVHHAYFKV